MISAIMLMVIVLVIVFWSYWSASLGTRREKSITKVSNRKLRPEEFDWGDGKDLSYFLAKKTKLGELEQWYMDNHSKDAEILRLQGLITKKSALIAKIQARLTVLERERHVVLSQDSYYDYWKQDLNAFERSVLNSPTKHEEWEDESWY